MVDPVFKAPTPPQPIKAPEVSAPVQPEVTTSVQTPAKEVPSENSTSVSQSSAESSSKKQQILDRLDQLKAQMIRYFWYSVGGLFLLGAFFGCAMSGSDAPPQQTPSVTGISARVVSNKDKKGRMPICGSASASQACLFYVLNHSDRDRFADDFFENTATAMQRLPFNLRRDNPLYGKTLIKPGYFAEIIVPAL